jgi:serine/threonine protein phosphatase PrpC
MTSVPGTARTPQDAPAPAAAPPYLTWTGRAGRLRALTVWTERRPGHGEDAEPLAVYHRPSGTGLLAVLDGSGGSGAAPAWQAPDGGTHTGAWVGARAARLGTQEWFRRAVVAGGGDTPHSLADHLRRALHAARPATRSKITGSMRRTLPTTLAAVAYGPGEGTVRWRALWAGDSRAYALLPATGLHALTRDDTAEDDALAQLRQDPPMTNVVCADRPFTVSAHPAAGCGEFPLPCVLLAATDGCFGYVHTPALWECVLLDTLMRARNAADWAARLRRSVQAYTADDASISLAALGFDDFPALRAAYRERYEWVWARYVDGMPPPGEPDGRDRAAVMREWQEETWRSYRPAYERFMPPRPEAEA